MIKNSTIKSEQINWIDKLLKRVYEWLISTQKDVSNNSRREMQIKIIWNTISYPQE